MTNAKSEEFDRHEEIRQLEEQLHLHERDIQRLPGSIRSDAVNEVWDHEMIMECIAYHCRVSRTIDLLKRELDALKRGTKEGAHGHPR